MADNAAAAATTSGATSKGTQNASKEKTANVKPERPNDEEFKANVLKADKELAVAQERMVSIQLNLLISSTNFVSVFFTGLIRVVCRTKSGKNSKSQGPQRIRQQVNGSRNSARNWHR